MMLFTLNIVFMIAWAGNASLEAPISFVEGFFLGYVALSVSNLLYGGIYYKKVAIGLWLFIYVSSLTIKNIFGVFNIYKQLRSNNSNIEKTLYNSKLKKYTLYVFNFCIWLCMDVVVSIDYDTGEISIESCCDQNKDKINATIKRIEKNLGIISDAI
jgi:hypothetical protein